MTDITFDPTSDYPYFDAIVTAARKIAVNGEDIDFWSGDESDDAEEFTIRVEDIADDSDDTWFELDGQRVNGREIGIAIGFGKEGEREHTAYITLYTLENSQDSDETSDENYALVSLNYLRSLMDPHEEADIYPHLVDAAHRIHQIDETLDIRFMLTDNHVDKSLQVPTILGMNLRDEDQQDWQQLGGQQIGPYTADVSLGSFDNEHWNIWIFMRTGEK